MTTPRLTGGPSPGGALPSIFQSQTPRREMSLVGHSGPREGAVHSSTPWLKSLKPVSHAHLADGSSEAERVGPTCKAAGTKALQSLTPEGCVVPLGI